MSRKRNELTVYNKHLKAITHSKCIAYVLGECTEMFSIEMATQIGQLINTL